MPTTDMATLGTTRPPATAALLGPAAAASPPLRSTSHQPAPARLCAGALWRPPGSPPGAGSGFGTFRKGSGRAGSGRRAFQKDLETKEGGVTRAPPRAARQYCGGTRPAPLRGARSPLLRQCRSSVLPTAGVGFALSEKKKVPAACLPPLQVCWFYGYHFRHQHQNPTKQCWKMTLSICSPLERVAGFSAAGDTVALFCSTGQTANQRRSNDWICSPARTLVIAP